MDSPPNEDEENGSGDRPHDAQHEQVNAAVVSFGPAGQSFHGHEGQRIDHGLMRSVFAHVRNRTSESLILIELKLGGVVVKGLNSNMFADCTHRCSHMRGIS